jgi:hypothetical protein
MGFIIAVGTLVVAMITRVLVKVLADECEGWFCWIAERVIRLAVRLLPKDLRERYSEEWHGCLNEMPGEIGKLFFALGLLLAGTKMSRIERESQLPQEHKSEFTVAAVLVAKPGPPVSVRIVFGTPVPKDDVSK